MALSSLCLAVIKSNFEAFMTDFLSSEGKVPRKHFEFLQRQYSKDLLESFREDDPLPDDYYSFLINVHLKELDVSLTNFQNVDVLVERLTEVGDSIINLSMKYSIFSEEELRNVVSLVPNIEELNLIQTDAEDTTIEAINSHAPLHTLNVSFCKITNAALKHLCEKDDKGLKPNHVLKHLRVAYTDINEAGVTFSLMNFPSLETLDHCDVAQVLYNIYVKHDLEATLNTVTKFNLTTLTIFEDKFKSNEAYSLVDVLKAISFLCPNLLVLALYNLTSSVAVSTWSLFSNLQEINVIASIKMNFTPLVESRGLFLKKIVLENGELATDSFLKCSKLEHLNISNIDMKPPSESTISQWDADVLANMESLTFAYTDLDESWDSVIVLVKSSPNLQSLTFEYCKMLLEDKFVDDISECKCTCDLKNLSFNGTTITSDSIKEMLLHAKCLTELNIEDCDISFTEYQEIKSYIESENSSLKILWMPRQSYDDFEYDLERDLYEFEVLSEHTYSEDEYYDEDDDCDDYDDMGF